MTPSLEINAAVPSAALNPFLGLLAGVLSLFGLNTPTAPTDPLAALVWKVLRQIETAVGAPPPVAGTPTSATTDTTTGTVTGTLGVTQAADLPLEYTVSTHPTQGSVTVDSTGAYAYSPTATARNNATATATTTDTFTVIASNGLASTIETINVSVAPDKPVAGTPTVGLPNPNSGAVVGTLGFIDPTGQPLIYVVITDPTQGSVTLTADGSYTYIPTQAARLTAGTSTGTSTIADTFTVTATNTPTGNTTAETVTVPVSPTQLGIADTISMGIDTEPEAVAISPDGTSAYVTEVGGTAPNSLSVIDTATNTVTATIPVTVPANDVTAINNPIAVAITPNGEYAYVSDIHGIGASTVSVINTATNTITATILVGGNPYGTAFSSDGSTAYVANANGWVSVIDTATNTITATIRIDANSTYDVAVSPNGRYAYVSSGGSISVIDTATNTVTSTIANVGEYGLAFTPDGSQLYVAEGGAGLVAVINTATSTFTIVNGYGGISPSDVAVSPDGSVAYVVDSGAGELSAIDTATNTLITSIYVGNDAQGLAVSPDGKTIYVANYHNDVVTGYLSVISVAPPTTGI